MALSCTLHPAGELNQQQVLFLHGSVLILCRHRVGVVSFANLFRFFSLHCYQYRCQHRRLGTVEYSGRGQYYGDLEWKSG